MSQRLQVGEFHGATRRQIESTAYAFVEVEDFVNGRVPTHTHESAHFLCVMRGKYEASA